MQLWTVVKKLKETVALHIAKADANSSCVCITYQPKQPAGMKKMRKG